MSDRGDWLSDLVSMNNRLLQMQKDRFLASGGVIKYVRSGIDVVEKVAVIRLQRRNGTQIRMGGIQDE